MKNKFLLLLLLSFISLKAQQDTIRLKDLVVSDSFIFEADKVQNVLLISDSIIKKSPYSLTDLLKLNSPVFFKENGYGMVSSPSFRGTSAQQTSVFWNGINVNSLFLGQSDFNTINSNDYEQIAVKLGGGSVVYGSGAIGGSIHLNNTLNFNQKIKHEINLLGGSFGTAQMGYKMKLGKDKWAFNLVLNRNQSNNDFEIKKKNYKNLNGEFHSNTLGFDVGYKINQNQKLFLYNQIHSDLRHFSLIEPTESKTKYYNDNIRNLVHWNFNSAKDKANVKAGYIYEKFRYFDDIDADNYLSSGTVSSFVLNTDYRHTFYKNLNLSTLGQVQKSYAKGDGSGIGQEERLSGSIATLLSHQVNSKLYYEAGIRKEFSNDFKSPLLYSFGFNYEYLKNLKFKINYSKNFRMPTFNDLFWQPGGNLNLKAETANQLEISNEFNNGIIDFNLVLYYNKITDMIRWTPTQQGYWAPKNTNNVESKGFETYLNAKLYSSKEFNLKLNATYAYTEAVNKQNNELLPYVPKNKFNGTISSDYKNWNFYLQNLFVDEFRINESETNKVKAYTILNTGLYYSFGKENKFNIGVDVYNLTNKIYQSMPNRYMPPRQYLLKFNIQFI